MSNLRLHFRTPLTIAEFKDFNILRTCVTSTKCQVKMTRINFSDYHSGTKFTECLVTEYGFTVWCSSIWNKTKLIYYLINFFTNISDFLNQNIYAQIKKLDILVWILRLNRTSFKNNAMKFYPIKASKRILI